MRGLRPGSHTRSGGWLALSCSFTSPELQCPHPEREAAKAHLGGPAEGRLGVELPCSVWWGEEEAGSKSTGKAWVRARGPLSRNEHSCDAS